MVSGTNKTCRGAGMPPPSLVDPSFPRFLKKPGKGEICGYLGVNKYPERVKGLDSAGPGGRETPVILCCPTGGGLGFTELESAWVGVVAHFCSGRAWWCVLMPH